jgi:tRNA (guanine37-N1)-methyltransferase
VIFMSAQGRLLDQKRAAEIAALERVVIVCGHYKGVDQRFVDAHVDEEISIGDYVLSGGEIPAMVLVDAVARLLPGVIGDIDSADTDSHARPGRLGWPVYTRPQEFEGVAVPEVLLSGHHANIGVWQTLESLRLTRENRPDLLHQYPVTASEQDLLEPQLARKRRKARKKE